MTMSVNFIRERIIKSSLNTKKITRIDIKTASHFMALKTDRSSSSFIILKRSPSFFLKMELEY